MAKTRGGGQVGSRRSRRKQGLEVEEITPQVAPATTLKVNKKRKAKKVATSSSTRNKKVAAQDDEVEDITPQDNVVEDVIPQDDAVDNVTPSSMEADQTEKAMSENEKEDSEIEGEACLTGQEQKEDEEEAPNIDEAIEMEKDGVGNGQDNAIPSNTDEGSQVSVTFNDFGDHVGSGSITLSSFLGVLVREHVPVTISDWRKVDTMTKQAMWEEIQGRFNLQEKWQRVVIFKQMGNIWRGWKSRLLSKTNAAFMEISDKYRKMRQNQIPHTTSRKGMLRLADDMKKKSKDPSKVTRSKVWIAGHTHANGRPVKPQFAETIEQIQSLDSEMDSTSAVDNIREDAVSKILGKDKPGRVRGFGRGITATKLAFLQSRDAEMAEMKSEIEELKGIVRDLAGKKVIHFITFGDVVVGEGEFRYAEPMYKIGRIPIGPNAMAVLVKSALSSEASLWRPTTDVLYLEEAVGCKIPWPMDKVLLYKDPVASENVSMQNKEGETRRCKINDWTNKDDEVIAEGVVCSSNSKEKVNNIPLGPSAVCRDCRNLCHQSVEEIVEHLVIRGMDKKYKTSCWSIHGEKRASTEDSGRRHETEAFDLFKTAFSMNEGEPNQTNGDEALEANDDEAVEETQFRKKLREAETPLYSDCIKYTKVSAIMGLYRFKVKSGVSENYFDQLLDLIKDMLPEDNNDCILYRKEFEKLDSCPRCKVSRWEKDKHSNEIKVGIPTKVLRYFPIKDRFRRMFRSNKMAEDLRWHYTNGTEDGTMRHPVDSISWAQVNAKWPDFSAEPRNLRLGISTDGMNPFSMQNTNHSTWPVLLVNYNTPPTMCMKAENIMLTL
ncbi:unnamed protein product [Microthlaspi erraticum]|nr:unnamed protein product [Microthlaspi erraticum]